VAGLFGKKSIPVIGIDISSTSVKLIELSKAGLRAGLEFDLIKPGNESAKEFYVEFPINITVAGRYHEFGDFVSGLSELNRIVSVHNVRLVGGKAGKASSKLTMTMVAKTYRAKRENEDEG